MWNNSNHVSKRTDHSSKILINKFSISLLISGREIQGPTPHKGNDIIFKNLTFTVISLTNQQK